MCLNIVNLSTAPATQSGPGLCHRDIDQDGTIVLTNGQCHLLDPDAL